MRISPRYEGPDIITFADGADVAEAFVRQRQRQQATLSSLDDGEWGAQSRCGEWTVQDVVAHLDIVNQFFHGSIAAGLAGTPTRMLMGFDPKATPAAMVDDVRSASPDETLAGFVKSNETFCDLVAGLDDEQWSTITEAPAGLLAVSIAVHHALWDAWVHERDIALPLGRTPTEDPDEIKACLRFVAAFTPALALNMDMATPPATLVIDTTSPDFHLTIEATDRVTVHESPTATTSPRLELREPAVPLLEALSVRAPLPLPPTA